MDPFEILPSEEIAEICEKLSPGEIKKFMRTNWRNYQVCSRVLKKKKIELLKGTWEKSTNNQVFISLPKKDTLYIYQYIQYSNVPPVLPEMKSRTTGDRTTYAKFIDINDDNQIDYLIKKLRHDFTKF